MSLLGLIGLIFLLYTFYIIGRVLYTGYSFMRAMGIKPKFTRKGPKLKPTLVVHNAPHSSKATIQAVRAMRIMREALRATQNLATAKYLVKTKENISTLKK